MGGFDLDLAFPVDEVGAGVRRVLTKAQWEWTAAQGDERWEFRAVSASGARLVIGVEPLPTARRALTLPAERSLLTVSGDAVPAEELADLRRRLILAFLRAAG